MGKSFKVREFLTPLDRKVLTMRLEGKTHKDIGKEFGLSSSRCQQLVQEAGLKFRAWLVSGHKPQ